jgi:hypothetical protein
MDGAGATSADFWQPAKNVVASNSRMKFIGFTRSACGKEPPFSIKRCNRRTPPGRRNCRFAHKIARFDFAGGGFYEILCLEKSVVRQVFESGKENCSGNMHRLRYLFSPRIWSFVIFALVLAAILMGTVFTAAFSNAGTWHTRLSPSAVPLQIKPVCRE